ncbi:MAG: leishmanolysin-related zinc metalloendopeptidase [Gemmatimonadaceae bacterium]
MLRPVVCPFPRIILAAAAAALGGCSSGPTTGGSASDYVLEIRWLSTPPTGATLEAFESARTTIRSTITGALSPVMPPAGFNIADCDPNDTNLQGFPDVPAEAILGLVVYIQIREMDGVGGKLGSAGPCLVRSASQKYLTALGIVRLDAADVSNLEANGRLVAVVLHELLHVVGFGTIWLENGLRDTTDVDNARFLGARARAACAEVHGGGADCATTVPLHSADGAGSAYSHWRETLFTNELMTPFLNSPPTPFSEMTIQSLGDLGYQVSSVPAQPYLVSGTFLRAEGGAPELPPQAMPEPTRPVFTLDDAGNLIPFRSPR